MKKIILSIIVTLFVFSPSITEARSYRSKPSDVYVNGYYRKDGTYVSPYYRSAPDSSILNNYSCIDNGKCGTTNNNVTTYTNNNKNNLLNYYYTTPTYPVYNYTFPTYVPEVKTNNQLCIELYSNSFYNNATKQCDCNYGYAFDNETSKCVEGKKVCQKLYGETAIYNQLLNNCTYTQKTTTKGTNQNTYSYTANPCPEHAVIANATCKCDKGYEFTHGATRCSKIK